MDQQHPRMHRSGSNRSFNSVYMDWSLPLQVDQTDVPANDDDDTTDLCRTSSNILLAPVHHTHRSRVPSISSVDGSDCGITTPISGYTTVPLVPERHSPNPDKRNDAESGKENSSSLKAYLMDIPAVSISATVVVPLVAFVAWLSLATKARDQIKLFSGEHIGGRLSQTNAKAIDFACSAIFVPLLMVPFNYIWFGKARTYAVNEQRNACGVPLSVLAEASSTSSGTYDMAKLYTLFTGKTWRLFLLGFLTLLAAVSKTSFANMIAYESYMEDVSFTQPLTLRMLLDGQIDGAAFIDLYRWLSQNITDPDRSLAPTGLDLYGFNIRQQSDMAIQITALFGGVNTESAVSKLDNGIAYIGTNSTRQSMDTVPEHIVSLFDVPAYMLTTECAAAALASVEMDRERENAILVRTDDDQFLYTFSGILQGLDGSAKSTTLPFSAFSTDSHTSSRPAGEIILGFLANGSIIGPDPPEDGIVWIPSPFGRLRVASTYIPSRNNDSGWALSAWGVRCSILRQEGTLNYTRSAGLDWKISGKSFSEHKRVVPSFLADWQVNLNYRAPSAVMSGIAPALARTGGFPRTGIMLHQIDNNWTTFAANYLYASGEAERITYEVAASDIDRDDSSFYHSVSAISREQFYRITYIPSILLLGLTCTLAAVLITGGMAVYARNTRSAKDRREVDVLRLIVDSAIGLQGDASAATAAKGSKSRLEGWAKGFQVAYVVETENYEVVLRLARVDGKRSEG